jgi:hypothetical protein
VLSRAALATLKQAAQLIPNQTMPINTIPLLEAKDSSEIENIVTTADKLFQFAQAHDGAADAATKEALRYRTALYAGFESLARRPLGAATAVEICRTIKAADIDVRRVPGTQLANAANGQVIYTPPEGEAQLRESRRSISIRWCTWLLPTTGSRPSTRSPTAPAACSTFSESAAAAPAGVWAVCDKDLISIRYPRNRL